ncbi:ROT2 Glucosidase 2 subunit alpha [Candida maltosa Xu316]
MKLLLAIVFFISYGCAVKDYLFKTCAQSGFCHRNRHYAKEVANSANFTSPYSVNSIESNDGVITGVIVKDLPQLDVNIELPFEITIVEDSFRFRLSEKRDPIPGHVNSDRYNETEKWAFKDQLAVDRNVQLSKSHHQADVKYGNHEVIITFHPITFVFKYNGKEQLRINEQQFLNIEHRRSEEDNELHLLPQESSFDMFHDSFDDSKSDSLPLGPESVAVDFSLVGFSNLYGIPEHADSLLLKDTSTKEPYRLYNVDIFEYETDSRLPMYGSIPFLTATKPDASVGIFWVNSADSYIDIKKDTDSSTVHWISENGLLDFVVIIEDSPNKVTQQYGKITGFTQLPPLFSLGYHQCRWNYNDQKDVLDVHAKFDEYEIPYDTIWLDIEYTDNKKYFTWDKETFPDPEKMLNVLDRTGRNLVAIIDPHIKTGYDVSNEILKKNIAMKNSANEPYFGHCWPGESIWIDSLNPDCQNFWNKKHKQFMTPAHNIYLWNDMNEPSVFNGPETSAPKDNLFHGQWELRSIHNLYGLSYHERTYNALLDRLPSQRPFILTRSYFAGSQRTAAMWTGDNMSKWEYLKISIPMVLTSNVVGMPFAGADVGGFFGNPTNELLTRWYQTGIWYPFFRAHAHIDSRRREPWLAGEPYTGYIRDAIKLRYALLPVFYTSFYESSINGTPVLKPLFYENPQNLENYNIDDEFFVGNSGILVKPITSEGEKEVQFALPDDEVYYDFTNGVLGKVYKKGSKQEVGLDGGSIIPLKTRYRRSSKLMKLDPYSLIIALDKQGKATGKLYADDGETFTKGVEVNFSVDKNTIRATVTGEYLPIPIEKITIVSGHDLVTIANSHVNINSNWELPFEFTSTHIDHDEL